MLERQVVSTSDALGVDLPHCPTPASMSSSSRRATGSAARRRWRSTSSPAAAQPVTWAKPPAGGLQGHARQGDVRAGRDRERSSSRARSRTARRWRSSRRRTATATAGCRCAAARPTFELPIEGDWAPRLPVHFVLMRGASRRDEAGAGQRHRPRAARPPSAATTWLEVEPKDNRVDGRARLSRSAPAGRRRSRWASDLKDPDGEPLPGEVTLWLVDQAVLALGREPRLDPLPDFIIGGALVLHRARHAQSLIFGFLPFAEEPGGDEGEASRATCSTARRSARTSGRCRTTTRRSMVGPDGSRAGPGRSSPTI